MTETMDNLVVTITAKQLYDILSRLDALEAANKTAEAGTAEGGGQAATGGPGAGPDLSGLGS